MMSEVVKMSLFCDTDMFNEQTLDQWTGERTVSSHETFSLEQEMTSCNGSSAMFRAITNFLNSTVQAKVDLSTFRHVHPNMIFGNDYLQPIVGTAKTEKSGNMTERKPDMMKDEKHHVQTPTNTVPTQPPYTYRAMICAALFMSETAVSRRSDIVNGIKSMFEVFRIDDPVWQKRWQRNVLKSYDWEKKTITREAGTFRLRYEMIDMSIFRKTKKAGDSYADDLFAEIGLPEKLEELRYIVESAKREERQRKKAMGAKTQEVTEKCQIPKLPSVTKSNKRQKRTAISPELPILTEECTSQILPAKEKNEELQTKKVVTNSSPEVTEKCSSLRLPSRPCFNDESSNDSLQLNMAATLNDSAHASTTALPSFSSTFSPQIPCFTLPVYSVPYISVPSSYWQA